VDDGDAVQVHDGLAGRRCRSLARGDDVTRVQSLLRGASPLGLPYTLARGGPRSPLRSPRLTRALLRRAVPGSFQEVTRVQVFVPPRGFAPPTPLHSSKKGGEPLHPAKSRCAALALRSSLRSVRAHAHVIASALTAVAALRRRRLAGAHSRAGSPGRR